MSEPPESTGADPSGYTWTETRPKALSGLDPPQRRGGNSRSPRLRSGAVRTDPDTQRPPMILTTRPMVNITLESTQPRRGGK
jgi:hypothetical protein